MKQLRVLLADDEPPARQRMQRLLATHEDVEIIAEAADGIAALETIHRDKPDLVLLDIEMPELDGLGVAAALPAGGPAIVFVTAYDEHALRAFELAAVDYLVKPVSADRLATALDKVRARKGATPDVSRLVAELRTSRGFARMAVRCGAKFVVFDPSRVSAVVARDHYAAVLVDGRELLSDDPIDALVARFDPEQFLRVHRSAAINLAFLKELVNEGDRKYFAVLSDADGTRVPVSRERLPELRSRLGI